MKSTSGNLLNHYDLARAYSNDIRILFSNIRSSDSNLVKKGLNLAKLANN